MTRQTKGRRLRPSPSKKNENLVVAYFAITTGRDLIAVLVCNTAKYAPDGSDSLPNDVVFQTSEPESSFSDLTRRPDRSKIPSAAFCTSPGTAHRSMTSDEMGLPPISWIRSPATGTITSTGPKSVVAPEKSTCSSQYVVRPSIASRSRYWYSVVSVVVPAPGNRWDMTEHARSRPSS